MYLSLDKWIDERIMTYMTRKSMNSNYSSYKLKHVAEREIGRYVSNDELKQVLKCKGVPHKKVGPNQIYPLSAEWKRGV